MLFWRADTKKPLSAASLSQILTKSNWSVTAGHIKPIKLVPKLFFKRTGSQRYFAHSV